MTRARLVLAVLLAPWAAPLLVLAATMAAGGGTPTTGAVVVLAGTAALVGYLGLLVIGLPMFHVLRQRGWLSPASLLVSGFVGGVMLIAACNLVMKGLVGASYAFPFHPGLVLAGAGLGLGVAIAFSLIAGIR